MGDQKSQGDILNISWCKHDGTIDDQILPKIPQDKKNILHVGPQDRFKIKPLGYRLLKYWCT